MAGATLLAAAALSFDAASAAATVPAASVVVVSDPGVTLTTPADGRLRGDHLAAMVTGVAFPARIGTGGHALKAAGGQRLVVFGLQGAHLRQTFDADSKPIPPVTGTLVVDGQRTVLPVPLSDDGTTPIYYQASVPAGSKDVAVELAASGLAQTFSLTQEVREGGQPIALYRDRETWEPQDQVNAEQDLLTPDPADDLPGATLPIRVHDVYLSWFGPDSPADVPASVDQGWLVVDATSQDDTAVGTRYLHYLSGLTAAQVTLTVPGGAPIVSQLFEPGTAENGIGVFDGIYAFSVPADITTATLTVAPGALQVTVAYSGSTPRTVTARGQASFPIIFPAVYQPPPQPAVTSDAQQAALAPIAAGAGGATHNFPIAPITVALVVVAAAAAGVVLVRNRHRTLSAPIGPALAGYAVIEPDTPDPPISPRPQDPPAPRSASQVSPLVPPPPLWPSAEEPSAPGQEEAAVPASTGSNHRPIVKLAAIPAGPPVPPPGFLDVGVLGPFTVTGWPDGQVPSQSVVELAVYLALHPGRPRTADDLRDPLSTGRAKALSADTIRTYANTLRRVLGADRVPDAARRGYTLVGAGSDWQRFERHLGALGVDSPPAEEAAALVAALALIRGRPYSELPRSGYGWVGTELLISEAEAVITATAQRLTDLAAAARDWTLASWAAERGLIVDPVSEDLNAVVLRSAAATGKPDRLAQTWRDVIRRFAAADEALPPRLADVNAQLKQGF